MKSIALWYEPLTTESQCDNENNVDLHLNLWKLPIKGNFIDFIKFWKRKDFKRALDIGIKLYNAKKIKVVKIYFPYELNKDDFSDLGSLITDKTNLACAIFNENIKVTREGDTDFYEINSKSQGKFYIYKLDTSLFNTEPTFGGTILTINIPQKYDDLYIRFRLSKGIEKFSLIEKPYNSVFQSAFSRTEVIDFRINHNRVLDNKLLEKIDKDCRFTTNKIHFFLLCSSREELIFINEKFHGCRQLEDDIWNTYYPELIDKKERKLSFSAYHWKQTSQNKVDLEFSTLVKTKFEHNDKLTIIKYIIVLSLLTILLNLASSFIWDKMCAKEKPQTTITKKTK